MGKRVFVTGMGIVSSIGRNLPETISSLNTSRSGIGFIRFLQTPYKDFFPFAEVPFSNEDLLTLIPDPVSPGYSRNALLGMIAAREAFIDARLDGVSSRSTGLISATTVGGMDQCERYYEDFLSNNSRNEFIDAYDCADSTQRVADALKIRDYVTTISTACSSAANAILLGARMIRTGQLERVIAGGTEALTGFHINGFNALKILAKEPCQPFDANRNGITLGEGAAYIALESEEAAKSGNRKIYAELIGYGNACEAFHQTASSPDGIGAYLAMKKALDSASLTPDDVDYINAHGTGTDNNDLSEGLAIERLFGDRVPRVSSTKPMTGHTTSAAGCIEAIISILCLRLGLIPPNLNYQTPMPELHFTPITTQLINQDIRVVLSNSFGFGGNDTSLIFKKI